MPCGLRLGDAGKPAHGASVWWAERSEAHAVLSRVGTALRAFAHPTELTRQQRRSHQKLVDRVRGLAAFADRPDDERLAATHVAGGKDLVERGAVVVGRGGDVAALVEF